MVWIHRITRLHGKKGALSTLNLAGGALALLLASCALIGLACGGKPPTRVEPPTPTMSGPDPMLPDAVLDSLDAIPSPPVDTTGLSGSAGLSILQASNPNRYVQAAVRQAVALLGTPYVWNGKDPSRPKPLLPRDRNNNCSSVPGDACPPGALGGLDCSGLVAYSFRSAGIQGRIPDGTQYMISPSNWNLTGFRVQPVSFSDLSEGDIVFYSHKNSRGVIAVDHAGIYTHLQTIQALGGCDCRLRNPAKHFVRTLPLGDPTAGTWAGALRLVAKASKVTVTPERADIQVGGSLALSAHVEDSQQNELPDEPVEWASLDPSVATVKGSTGQTAIVRAIGGGTVKIVASSGGAQGVSTINVPRVVASVVVSPPAATVNLPSSPTISLSASAKDASGNEIAEAPIAWISSNPSIATVTPLDGPSAVVTAVAAGTAMIHATTQGKDAICSVTVTRRVGSVDITPAAIDVGIGSAAHASATAKDEGGVLISDGTFTWDSADPSIATVDPGGSSVTVRGVAPGSTQITATSGSVSSHAQVTVAETVSLLVYTSIGCGGVPGLPYCDHMIVSAPGFGTLIDRSGFGGYQAPFTATVGQTIVFDVTYDRNSVPPDSPPSTGSIMYIYRPTYGVPLATYSVTVNPGLNTYTFSFTVPPTEAIPVVGSKFMHGLPPASFRGR